MNYIVRYKGKILCFYHDGNSIMLKEFLNGQWSNPFLIFNDAKNEYTINISDDQINLFCQNSAGNPFLCTYKNNAWQNKIILQNQFNYPLQIHPLMDKKDFSLFYNMPADKNNFYLVINKLKENRWQPSVQIDKSYGLDNFCVQRLGNNHLIVFYMTNSDGINLGYREISSTQQSKFHIIHSTYYKITDAAFLTTTDTIHSLYTVKNMFTKQIVYRKKQDVSFSKPIVLFESPNINNNLLMEVKNNLYAAWMVNNKIYVSISKDDGFTFSVPKIHNESFSNLAKAKYLTDEKMSEENFFIREVYVEKEQPWQIIFMPDMQKDFFQIQDGLQNQLHKKNEPRTDEIISKLKNQLDMKNNQLAQKDKQIYNLTNLLKNKNDEIISLSIAKKNKPKDV